MENMDYLSRHLRRHRCNWSLEKDQMGNRRFPLDRPIAAHRLFGLPVDFRRANVLDRLSLGHIACLLGPKSPA